MIKTYLKTLARMFGKHVTRLLSLIFMVLISVGFISGIGSSTDKINYSLTDYYKAQNVSDLILKSTADNGFTDEDIQAIADIYGEENVQTGMSLDVNLAVDGEERLTRLYFLDLENITQNIPEYYGESRAADETEAYADRADNKIIGYADGEEVTLDFYDILNQLSDGDLGQYENLLKNLKPVTVTVVGTVQSPLTFANDGEPSYKNPEDTEIPDDINGVNSLITLENILYLSKDIIPTQRDLFPFLPDTPLIGTGDIYVTFSDRDLFDSYSPEYKTYVNAQKQVVAEALGEDVRVLTLYENYSFLSLNSYSKKVAGIGIVLMVAFLLVTALVVLSTMTRLMEEERSQMACLKTLGYSSPSIVSKYVLFAMVATGIGGVGAYFVGIGLAYLIYKVFNYSFVMPVMSSHIAIVFYLIVFAVIVVTTLGTTVIAGHRITNETPANMLRPKPPRVGKKVFIEKIPIIWNSLSFKYKSTTRNVLRYLNRFIMTVVAVAFSTALVLTGLALLDVCLFGGLESPSVMAIAVVVVVFAGLLTMVVIYTLTNINISERNRELATLMVLGYFDGEVAGYIYREIYIDTVVGIIFGYPLSTLLMALVFSVMGMGTIGGVSWFMWLAAPFITILFTALVTLMLRRKIVKIDMNESLKAIE